MIDDARGDLARLLLRDPLLDAGIDLLRRPRATRVDFAGVGDPSAVGREGPEVGAEGERGHLPGVATLLEVVEPQLRLLLSRPLPDDEEPLPVRRPPRMLAATVPGELSRRAALKRHDPDVLQVAVRFQRLLPHREGHQLSVGGDLGIVEPPGREQLFGGEGPARERSRGKAQCHCNQEAHGAIGCSTGNTGSKDEALGRSHLSRSNLPAPIRSRPQRCGSTGGRR